MAVVFADKASYAVGHRLLPPASGRRATGRAGRFAECTRDPKTYRTLAWALVMSVTGIMIGSLVLLVVLAFARELTLPLWWWAVPPGTANTAVGLPIDTWAQAVTAMATAPVYLAVAVWVLPPLAIGQARLCAAALGCSVPTRDDSHLAARDTDPATRGVSRTLDKHGEPHTPNQGVEPPSNDEPLGRLTARETEVLRLMAHGMDNSAIAGALVVTQAAVLKHIRSIFIKFDLPPGESGHRRVQAVLIYLSRANAR